MSNGAFKIVKTGVIAALAVVLVFAMTFNSKIIALDETQEGQVQSVVDLIGAIPEVDDLTLEHGEVVSQARNAYEELDDELENESALTAVYDRLVASEQKISDLVAADKVIKKIDKIPALSKLKWNQYKLVKAARNAYNNLTRAQKSCIPKAEYEKLKKAWKKVKSLRHIHLSKLEAGKVVKKINKIPKLAKLKLKHSKIVSKAMKAYKKVTKTVRKYVPASKVRKLKKADKKIKLFKKQIKKFKKARPKIDLKASNRLDIKVSWTKVKNAKKYIVYRKVNKYYHKIKVTKERSFIDENRFKTLKNTYKVKAVGNIGGKKVYSKYSYSLNKTLLAKSTVVKATAYSGGGHCANGMPVGVGRIATDPRYIPLGTWLYVEGYGLSQACDTGGAIKGWFIDVYFTSNGTCNSWGVKHPRVWILR